MSVYSEIPYQTGDNHLLEYYLQMLCSHSPVIDRVISRYGSMTVSRFLADTLTTINPTQGKEDLNRVLSQYVTPLLGKTVTRHFLEDLDRCPVVLTTNHHGVDFFSQSIQGSLIFSLRIAADGYPVKTVPVFSCGGISLNNLTYPRGLLVYQTKDSNLDNIPLRIPLFPDRQKRQIVSNMPCFDESMIQRATQMLANKLSHRLPIEILTTLYDILLEEYCRPSVLVLPTYSYQATVLNHQLWKKMFAPTVKYYPQLVYLEFEKIATQLLQLDLDNEDSLISSIFFDKQLRENILNLLDGAPVCWNRNTLSSRLNGAQKPSKENASSKSGTVFFWGIDDSIRRVPLDLVTDHGRMKLRGITDTGQLFEVPFKPESIIEKLQQNKLMPSLFTNFAVVSFARGITCLGGYYQVDYLPRMQEAVVAALCAQRNYDTMASDISRVPCDRYLAGMQTVMRYSGREALVPAGSIEIITAGGLDNGDMEKIRNITVTEAHQASLFETIPDIMGKESGEKTWKNSLATACHHFLCERVVIK